MTLLQIIQDAADEIGIGRPTSVVSSTDIQVRQLLAMANREGKDLVKRASWQECQKEATFTTVATEDQGTVESKAPGFNWNSNQTMWNRTTQRLVDGGLSAQEWQYRKASVATGPYHDFRIRNKNLYLFPTPPAGETVAFEYISRYWCQSSGGTGQERWVADTDTGILSEDIMTIGVIWRFKKAKGLDYTEDFNTYESQVLDAIARNGGKQVLSMDTGYYERDIPRGVRAPDGSWNL